ARAENSVIDGFSTRFEVIDDGRPLGTVAIPAPGVHVALNSLAAIGVALELGIDFALAARALAKFGGIQRRFEIKGEKAGRLVLDDYARHPAEVRATLAMPPAPFKRRLVAVFHPPRFSRGLYLFDEYLGAFDEAGALFLLDIYPAGEDPIHGVSSRRLYEALCARGHLEAHYLEDDSSRAREVAKASRPGDLIVTLGAGDIYRLGPEILDALGDEANLHERA